jgi:hypothetical protein
MKMEITERIQQKELAREVTIKRTTMESELIYVLHEVDILSVYLLIGLMRNPGGIRICTKSKLHRENIACTLKRKFNKLKTHYHAI